MDWNLRRYSKDEFTNAWMNSNTIKDCALALGLAKNGGSYKSLRLAASDLGLPEDHMRAVKIVRQKGFVLSLSEILVENSPYSSTSDLRKRLIKEGVLKAECSAPHCLTKVSVDPWSGESVEQNLTLDHINGINSDNRLENLRILCQYCHSYTKTFCGKKNSKTGSPICSCGRAMAYGATQCKKCQIEKTGLPEYSTEELIFLVEKHGYSRASSLLGYTDNGLRSILRRRKVSPLPRKIT